MTEIQGWILLGLLLASCCALGSIAVSLARLNTIRIAGEITQLTVAIRHWRQQQRERGDS